MLVNHIPWPLHKCLAGFSIPCVFTGRVRLTDKASCVSDSRFGFLGIKYLKSRTSWYDEQTLQQGPPVICHTFDHLFHRLSEAVTDCPDPLAPHGLVQRNVTWPVDLQQEQIWFSASYKSVTSVVTQPSNLRSSYRGRGYAE